MLLSERGLPDRVSALLSWKVFTKQPSHLVFYFSTAPCADHKQHAEEPARSITPVTLSQYQDFLPLFVKGKLGQVKATCALNGN